MTSSDKRSNRTIESHRPVSDEPPGELAEKKIRKRKERTRKERKQKKYKQRSMVAELALLAFGWLKKV